MTTASEADSSNARRWTAIVYVVQFVALLSFWLLAELSLWHSSCSQRSRKLE